MLNFIWAEDLNGTIGYQGTMPWHCHEDMVHFRQLTNGFPVIMGYKTFVSMGKRALPHRYNYVLTHRHLQQTNIHPLASIDEAQKAIQQSATDVFVIGGVSVFEQLLPLADRLYQTIIEGHYPSDTKMPPLNQQRWHLVEQNRVRASRPGEPNCIFKTWELATK